MAYAQLGSFDWGSQPKIGVKIFYDHKRSGADMQYRVKVQFNSLTGANYFGYPIYLTIKLDNSVKVSGYTAKAASPSQWSNAITYESAWLTVSNKANGATALTVTIYSGSGSNRNSTYNYSLSVDPAASEISASNGTLNSEQKITVSRYSTSFTHSIVATCGSNSQTVCTKVSNTSVSWTPPLAFATANTTGTSVTVLLTCTTFNGSTQIGVTTKALTMAIPTSVKPSVGMTVLDLNISAAAFGVYIQGKSKLHVSLTVAGAQGSSISSCSIQVIKGSTKLWTYSAQMAVTPIITVDGTITVTATVVDSRNRSSTTSMNVVVIPYSSPTVTSLKTCRCSEDGTIKPDGSYGKVSFSAAITSIESRNTAAYALEYREKGAAEWSSVSVSSAAGNYSPQDVESIFPADTEKTYEARIVATDAFGSIPSQNATIGVAFVLAQVTDDMTGIAFGQRATRPGHIQFGLPVEIQGSDIADFVVEQGTSGDWFYRKWNSGAAECWGLWNVSGVDIKKPINGVYYSEIITKEIPFAFANTPVHLAHISKSFWLGSSYVVIGSTDFSYTISSAAALDSQTCDVRAMLLGRWK